MIAEKDYFDIQNEKFYQHLDEMYGINKARTWEDIAKSISTFKIKMTYRLFGSLYPRKHNYLSELEKSSNNFSTIHYGSLKAQTIINEIVRFSLYSDKIIVFHPLQNPVITRQSMDPGRNPKRWLPDFLDALYFYIVIRKWVKEGIVKLIINPYDYDLSLRDTIDKEAHKRVESINQEEFYETVKDKINDHFAQQLGPSFKGKNKTYIISAIMEMTEPVFSQYEAEKMADRIIQLQKYLNPLYNKLPIPLNSDMIAPFKGGGPVESLILISEKTQGNIYTSADSQWYQIKRFGKEDFWTKVNKLYSDIPLTFLNNVDTSYALELRKEDRLAGVRQQLKKIYTELNSITFENMSESKIKILQEGFIEEIKKADAEWKDIKIQAAATRMGWIGANVAAPIVKAMDPSLMKNDLSILGMFALSMAWLYSNEKSVFGKMSAQRSKNPISVFVDLKNKEQSFFSNIKNCIF